MPPLCFKCKKAEGTFVNRDGSAGKLYCGDCFTEFLTRSVRDQLFSQCFLPCDLPVAVGVSGGPNSMLLLHQLGLLRAQNALRHGAGRVRFVFLPFHLCEEALVTPPLPSSPSASLRPSSSAEDVRDTFKAQFTTLRTLFAQQPLAWSWADAPLFVESELRIFRYTDLLDEAALETLRAFLHHPKLSLTDREELYASVKRSVMQLIATQLCHAWYDAAVPADHTRWVHCVTADNTVRSGVSALQSLVKGETGDGLVHKAGYRAFGSHGVVQLRPLRSVLPRESVSYCRLHAIANAYTPSLATCTSLRSIHRTLESFALQLHVHYRTALFNVISMTNKIGCADPIADAVVSGSFEAIAGLHGASADVSAITDPPCKKPRTGDDVTKRSGTASAAAAGTAVEAHKERSHTKPAAGRAAQYYRDACLRVPPPATRQLSTASDVTLDAPDVCRLCVLCGAPCDVAGTALTFADAKIATLCRRCDTALHHLRAPDHTAAGHADKPDEAGLSSSAMAQLMHVLEVLSADDATTQAPRRVKGGLSDADKAAFLLPDEDE